MYIKYISVDNCHPPMFIWCIYIHAITIRFFFWYGDVTCMNNSTHLRGLQDFRTLSDLGIEHGSSLVLVCSNKDTRLVQTNMFVRWKFKPDMYICKEKIKCFCFLSLVDVSWVYANWSLSWSYRDFPLKNDHERVSSIQDFQFENAVWTVEYKSSGQGNSVCPHGLPPSLDGLQLSTALSSARICCGFENCINRVD